MKLQSRPATTSDPTVEQRALYKCAKCDDEFFGPGAAWLWVWHVCYQEDKAMSSYRDSFGSTDIGDDDPDGLQAAIDDEQDEDAAAEAAYEQWKADRESD